MTAKRNQADKRPTRCKPIQPPLTPAQYRDLIAGLNNGLAFKYLAKSNCPKYNLEVLGAGTSRRVYKLPVQGYETTALKIQLMRQKFNQTLVETTCAAASDSPLVPEVYDWGPTDDDVRWVEIEYLKSASIKEFERLAGIPWSWFARGVSVLCDGSESAIDQGTPHWIPPIWRLRYLKDLAKHAVDQKRAMKFGTDIMQLVEECELEPREFIFLYHWGINSRGEIKISDLGLTTSISSFPNVGKADQNPTSTAATKQRLLDFNPCC
jgi:hypothetical protein